MDYSDMLSYLDELTSDSSGDILQAIANTPKYWSTKNLEAGLSDTVDVTRGQSLEDAAELKKSGFQNVRAKAVNLGTGMDRGVFVGYGDDAEKIGSMYAKNNPYRGSKFGDVTCEVFKGQVPKRSMQFSRNVWGHPQAIIPAGVANKAFNLPSGGVMNAIPKSRLTRFLARFFPGANIALGGTSAASRLAKGQPVRAGMAGVSMVPGPIGWTGLAAETVADYVVSAEEKRKKAEEEAARRAAASKKEAMGGGAAGSGTGQQTQRRRQQGTQEQEQRRKQRSQSRLAQRRTRFARKPNLTNRAQGGLVSINDLIRSL